MRFALATATFVTVAFLTLTAAAEPPGAGSEPRSQGPAATTGAADPDPSGAVVQGSQVTGRITEVDRDDGTVKIDLSNGEEISLVFPKSSLGSFQEGDTVTLTAHVGMAETVAPPAARGRTTDGD